MLRVDEKIFPSWAFFDDSLDTPGLFSLYSALWFGSYFGWELTQADLAHMGKMSLRSAQDNLKLLEQRGFIASRRQGVHKCYDLVLSPHVLGEFIRQGIEFQARATAGTVNVADAVGARALPPGQTRKSCAPVPQNPQARHAESAHPFKNIKEIKDIKNTPLSPLPRGFAPQAVAGSRSEECGKGEPCSCLEPSPPLLEASFSDREQAQRAARCRSSRSEFPDREQNFERLWAVWPNRQAKLPAQRVFASMARRGLLPPIETLLETVRRFQAEDSAWKKQYVPRLDHWLRDERWTDEPRTTGAAPVGAASPEPRLVAPAESPDANVQLQAASNALRREREEQLKPLSAKTVRELARISPMFRNIADKLCLKGTADDQARECEYGVTDQERTGKNRIPGEQTADTRPHGEGVFRAFGLRRTQGRGKNQPQLSSILEILDTSASGAPFFPLGTASFAFSPGFCPA